MRRRRLVRGRGLVKASRGTASFRSAPRWRLLLAPVPDDAAARGRAVRNPLVVGPWVTTRLWPMDRIRHRGELHGGRFRSAGQTNHSGYRNTPRFSLARREERRNLPERQAP